MAENTNTEKKDTKPQEKKREFILNKAVTAESVQPIIEGINEVNKYDDEQEEKDKSYVRKPINIIVDSFGGSVYCGLALANTVDTSKTPVYTYCFGKAMSMGFYIFALGHKRFAHENATLMYHDAGTTEKDTIEGIQQSIDQIKKVVKRMDGYLVKYTNLKQSKLDRVKKLKQNWYFFGDEGLVHGVVDEIIKPTREDNRLLEQIVENY